MVLSLIAAAYMVYGNQTSRGSSGAAGVGGEILLDLDELVGESELVVLGEMESSQTFTKTASDTSQPVSLRGKTFQSRSTGFHLRWMSTSRGREAIPSP